MNSTKQTLFTLFAVLPGLAACGLGQAYYVSSFSPEQQVFGEVTSERPIDSGDFAANATEAVRSLATAGISGDWSNVHVMVSASPNLGTDPSEVVIGHTVMGPNGPEITLAAGQLGSAALLHEMIHAWQLGHGNLLTEQHPGWQAKGWGCATWQDCPGTLDYEFHGVALDVTHAGPADRQEQP